MEIVYHLGAHCTDEERLLRCLLKNRGALSRERIIVPGPTRYRYLLRDTVAALKGQPASRDTQAIVLDQIMDEDHAERLIFSWENFVSFPLWAMKGTFYPTAPERIRAFANIFPEIESHFCLAIRNPATFLPALFDRQKADKSKARDWDGFLALADIHSLRWSDTLQAVLDANPGLPLTVWCDEDTPLVWPDVLQAVSGHGAATVLEDADELLVQLMAPEGLARLRAYLASHPPATPAHRRKITSAFLDKFALPERLTTRFEVPGWTAETVARLTETYERDVATITRMPGVRFLSPA